MKHLKTLVTEYNKASLKARFAREQFAKRIIFRGFHERYDFEMPSIEESSDGLIAVWKGKEMYIDEVLALMKKKGCIEPDDF